jgi:hypothetical protein
MPHPVIVKRDPVRYRRVWSHDWSHGGTKATERYPLIAVQGLRCLIEQAVLRWRKSSSARATTIELTLNSLAN